MKSETFKFECLEGLHPIPVRGRFTDLVREGTGETVGFPFLHCEGWVDMVPNSGPGSYPGYVPILHMHGMPVAWHESGSGEWHAL
jgi:hypothetical protein